MLPQTITSSAPGRRAAGKAGLSNASPSGIAVLLPADRILPHACLSGNTPAKRFTGGRPVPPPADRLPTVCRSRKHCSACREAMSEPESGRMPAPLHRRWFNPAQPPGRPAATRSGRLPRRERPVCRIVKTSQNAARATPCGNNALPLLRTAF